MAEWVQIGEKSEIDCLDCSCTFISLLFYHFTVLCSVEIISGLHSTGGLAEVNVLRFATIYYFITA